jgi:hypothetical protein
VLFINKQNSSEKGDFTKQISILKICFNFSINPLNIIWIKYVLLGGARQFLY